MSWHMKKRNGKKRLTPIRKVLVIGGGVAGIQSALDIADAGYEVFLVEKDPSIGGHMIQYSEVFPTLDCPQCILTPKMVEAGQHPNIRLMTYSEVEQVSGEIGDFTVRVRKKAAYVDWDKCNGCGLCQMKCATTALSEFERWLPFARRKAIYIPFGQAVPNKPVIDRENCRFFTKGKCQLCQLVCPTKAIDFQQQDTFVDINVGAIVVATGFELYPREKISEFEEDPDILDGIQFERILSPGGKTAGAVIRPSDGKTPKEVVFISCVGSRDPEHGVPYCSRVCCMYLAKMAMLYKHAVPYGQAYVFYMDVRSTGKGYEEFVQRAVEEDRVLYLRGRVSRVFREGDKLKVWGVDTLSGKRMEIACDLVVLGMAMVPSPAGKELAQKLGIATNEHGFITELHPKLRPQETLVPGIYVAGTAQGPKDIPDSVAQASAAASKVLTLFSSSELILEKVS
jgi:heterodisulfide reductase subunit A